MIKLPWEIFSQPRKTAEDSFIPQLLAGKCLIKYLLQIVVAFFQTAWYGIRDFVNNLLIICITGNYHAPEELGIN